MAFSNSLSLSLSLFLSPRPAGHREPCGLAAGFRGPGCARGAGFLQRPGGGEIRRPRQRADRHRLRGQGDRPAERLHNIAATGSQ